MVWLTRFGGGFASGVVSPGVVACRRLLGATGLVFQSLCLMGCLNFAGSFGFVFGFLCFRPIPDGRLVYEAKNHGFKWLVSGIHKPCWWRPTWAFGMGVPVGLAPGAGACAGCCEKCVGGSCKGNWRRGDFCKIAVGAWLRWNWNFTMGNGWRCVGGFSGDIGLDTPQSNQQQSRTRSKCG